MFSLYKSRLTVEINSKLTCALTSLITLAANPALQKRVKHRELINILSNVHDVDMGLIEKLMAMVKASSKQNKSDFIVGFYIKRHGRIGDQAYNATGRVTFKLYEELSKALEKPASECRVFGVKFAKKDVTAVMMLIDAVFGGSEKADIYSEGSNNNIFSHLAALLKIAYMVTSRLNEIAELMKEVKEDALDVGSFESDHGWAEDMETLCGMKDAIRAIPNQTDIRVEAWRRKIDESRAEQVTVERPTPVTAPVAPPAPPSFQPPVPTPAPVQQVPVYPPGMMPVAQVCTAQMSPEDIVRARMNGLQIPVGSQPV